MIIILHPEHSVNSEPYHDLIAHLKTLPDISIRIHQEKGEKHNLTELYLIGSTSRLDLEELQSFTAVEKIVRVSREYRILGRHLNDNRSSQFTYNGITFGANQVQVFAGLCAVDTQEHVNIMMKAIADRGGICTRMGAYKPRSNPYSFQGHGASCLPYVFEAAGKHGIKVIAMEITHDRHIQEIQTAMKIAGDPTGIMLQVGTRNTQNFELLKSIGQQAEYPILLKRGFGISLEESLNAAEYLASEGNSKVVFCLRGMKSSAGIPHRNMVDFSHVPVIKRLTHMPVCIDPSHSVGSRDTGPDGISDVFHVTTQGISVGATMVLVDFHPDPAKALVDGPQALKLSELDWFLEHVAIAKDAYERSCTLQKKMMFQDLPSVSNA